MTTWPKDQLQKIAATDDLHIAPFREDGVTYGTLTWIWSVAVDDGLFVAPTTGKARGGTGPRCGRRRGNHRRRA